MILKNCVKCGLPRTVTSARRGAISRVSSASMPNRQLHAIANRISNGYSNVDSGINIEFELETTHFGGFKILYGFLSIRIVER